MKSYVITCSGISKLVVVGDKPEAMKEMLVLADKDYQRYASMYSWDTYIAMNYWRVREVEVIWKTSKTANNV